MSLSNILSEQVLHTLVNLLPSILFFDVITKIILKS